VARRLAASPINIPFQVEAWKGDIFTLTGKLLTFKSDILQKINVSGSSRVIISRSYDVFCGF
jgi:hypothetical protein